MPITSCRFPKVVANAIWTISERFAFGVTGLSPLSSVIEVEVGEQLLRLRHKCWVPQPFRELLLKNGCGTDLALGFGSKRLLRLLALVPPFEGSSELGVPLQRSAPRPHTLT